MTDYWFFLSYARLEKDPAIARFRDQLAAKLRSMAAIPEEKNDRIGFLDGDGIEHGTDWPDALAEGLHASRVLVPFYSPLYFDREYCGREFQVFHNPASAYQNPGAVANLEKRPILPVLFYPLKKDQWPDLEAIRNLQYEDDRYPALYREKGLFYLMDSPQHDAEYREFVWKFAEKLVEVARKGRSRVQGAMPALKSPKHVTPMFPVPGTAANAREPEQPVEDLRTARFFCIAARKGEVSREAKAYGDKGGIDWKPFSPAHEEIAGLIAQDAARQERFLSDLSPQNSDVATQLQEAEADSSVVITLIDPWSLTLPEYKQKAALFDRLRTNCSVIVSWSVGDAETVKQRPVLEQAVRTALPNMAVAIRHPVYYRDAPQTTAQLTAEIRAALTEVHMRMLQMKLAALGRVADPPPLVNTKPVEEAANG